MIYDPAIQGMRDLLQDLADMSAAERIRWMRHNPSRVVTPVYFDRHDGRAMAFTGLSYTQWGDTVEHWQHRPTSAVAVAVCNLGRVLWL